MRIWVGVVAVLGWSGCGPSIVIPQEDETGSQPGGSTAASTPSNETTPNPNPDPPPNPPEATTMVPEPDPSTTDQPDADTTDDSCDFIGCGEYGDDSPTPVECDLFAQDCPEGEKCTAWANDGGAVWNATRCVEVARGAAGVGEPCTAEGSGVSGVDDCELRAMCWDVDDDLDGTCVAFCEGDEANPICGRNQSCSISGDSILTICIDTCSPLTSTCPDGQGCFAFGDQFLCAASANPDAGYNEPCQFATQCADGHQCIAAAGFGACGDEACCAMHCDLADPDADAGCAMLDPIQSCRPWYAEGTAPDGLENVGICAAP